MQYLLSHLPQRVYFLASKECYYERFEKILKDQVG